jgi:hypothetical protein
MIQLLADSQPCAEGFSAIPIRSIFRAPNIADEQFISAQNPAWARFWLTLKFFIKSIGNHKRTQSTNDKIL